jgi:hypothetical protein
MHLIRTYGEIYVFFLFILHSMCVCVCVYRFDILLVKKKHFHNDDNKNFDKIDYFIEYVKTSCKSLEHWKNSSRFFFNRTSESSCSSRGRMLQKSSFF